MKTRCQGMTLFELMAALAVLGVLFAMAAPSYRQFTSNSRTTAATNDLITALNLARSEALRRSGNAIACSSTDGAACGGTSDWSTGWIVFADPNGNNAIDAGELIQVWAGQGNGMQLTAQNANGDAVSRVVYNTMGMGQLPPGGRIRFSIVAPTCSGNNAGQTDVLLAGTIQSSKVACP